MLMYTNFNGNENPFPSGLDVIPEGPKWFNSLTKDLRRSLTDLLDFYDGRKVNFEDSKYDEGDEVELPDYFDSEENVGEVKGVYPETGVLIVSVDNETFVFDVKEVSDVVEQEDSLKFSEGDWVGVLNYAGGPLHEAGITGREGEIKSIQSKEEIVVRIDGEDWGVSSKDIRRLEFEDGDKVKTTSDYHRYSNMRGEVKDSFPNSLTGSSVIVKFENGKRHSVHSKYLEKLEDEGDEIKKSSLSAVKIPSNQYFSDFLQMMAFQHEYNFAKVPNDDAYLEYETRPTDDATRQWFIFNQEDHKISFARQLKNFDIDFKVGVITYERFKNALEGGFESDDEEPDDFLEESFAVGSENKHQREAYFEVAQENGFEKSPSWINDGKYIVLTKEGFIEYWNELKNDWVSEVYEDIGVGKLEELLNEKQVS